MLQVVLGEALVLFHQLEPTESDLNSREDKELPLVGESQELKELMKESRDSKLRMQRRQRQATILCSRLNHKRGSSLSKNISHGKIFL